MIFEHLTAFVADRGPGARKKIADASNGELTIDELFEMCAATPYPLVKWRVAEAAMQFIERNEKE